jgi:2-methylcitrate dehydratase PrpD
MPWSRIAAEVIGEERSHGQATMYGARDAAAPARVALVNATATHGIELDDIAPGHCHPGTAVVPAVLAVAEHFGLSGMRVLLGMIAGYEATSRTGRGIGEVGWGFHLPAIAGTVGAAVGGGVALGMPHEQVMRAVGIACSSAAGIRSFVQGSGGMVKRLHAGRAAESGVLACLLARRGFTAPLAALDGKFGLLEVFGGDKCKPQALDSELGEHFVISKVWTKMYPFCGGIHAMAQALQALRIQHSLDPSSISAVRVGVNHRAMALHTEVAPREMMAAQYSMPFVAATALAGDPRDPRSFMGNALDNSAVCDLARRVELYLDPEIDAIYPRHGAHVELDLANHRKLGATLLAAKGTPQDPCSEDEVKEKFRCLASAAVTDEAIVEIMSLVGRIETLPSVAPLSRALRSGMRVTSA